MIKHQFKIQIIAYLAIANL